MDDIFSLNRLLKKNIELTTPEFLATRLLTINFFYSEYTKRVRPDLLEQIKAIIDPEVLSMADIKFEPVKDEIGKTYALFASEKSEDGLCLNLKVEFNPNRYSNSPECYGSASNFKENFKHCVSYISKIIQSNLKGAYFY
ncbi:MAG: hypothetical protein ACPL25_11585, partial [Ignavibacteria bacterium]